MHKSCRSSVRRTITQLPHRQMMALGSTNGRCLRSRHFTSLRLYREFAFAGGPEFLTRARGLLQLELGAAALHLRTDRHYYYQEEPNAAMTVNRCSTIAQKCVNRVETQRNSIDRKKGGRLKARARVCVCVSSRTSWENPFFPIAIQASGARRSVSATQA